MTKTENTKAACTCTKRRLPLQPLHLPELRLLNETGRASHGAARLRPAGRLTIF